MSTYKYTKDRQMVDRFKDNKGTYIEVTKEYEKLPTELSMQASSYFTTLCIVILSQLVLTYLMFVENIKGFVDLFTGEKGAENEKLYVQ